MTLHRDLEARWSTFSLAEQLGSAGAEVGRALRAKSTGDVGRFEPALARGLELLDLAKGDARWAGPRRREIARAREVVCDFLVGDNQYGSTTSTLEGYFMAYALAARRDR